jgi:hypothetical protein
MLSSGSVYIFKDGWYNSITEFFMNVDRIFNDLTFAGKYIKLKYKYASPVLSNYNLLQFERNQKFKPSNEQRKCN